MEGEPGRSDCGRLLGPGSSPRPLPLAWLFTDRSPRDSASSSSSLPRLVPSPAVLLAPGDTDGTMKPIHKRLYTVLPRPPPVASTSSASTSTGTSSTFNDCTTAPSPPASSSSSEPLSFKLENTVLVNPGGPGGSGTNFAGRAGANLPRVLGSKRAVLGFDPRGTGASTPRLVSSMAHAEGGEGVHGHGHDDDSPRGGEAVRFSLPTVPPA